MYVRPQMKEYIERESSAAWSRMKLVRSIWVESEILCSSFQQLLLLRFVLLRWSRPIYNYACWVSSLIFICVSSFSLLRRFGVRIPHYYVVRRERSSHWFVILGALLWQSLRRDEANYGRITIGWTIASSLSCYLSDMLQRRKEIRLQTNGKCRPCLTFDTGQ